jgi:Predicted membrane protein/domain
MQPQENNNPACGGFFVRLAAYLIDLMLVGTMLLIVKIPMFFVRLSHPDNFLTGALLFRFSLLDILLYLAASAYFVILTYQTGATVGKRLMNLRVVSVNGEPLTLLNVLYRETIGRYLSSLLFVGYILVGVNNEKRGLHDMICDTKVIYVCKCMQLPPRRAYQPMSAYMPYYGQPVPPVAPVPQQTPAEPERNPADDGSTDSGQGGADGPADDPQE